MDRLRTACRKILAMIGRHLRDDIDAAPVPTGLPAMLRQRVSFPWYLLDYEPFTHRAFATLPVAATALEAVLRQSQIQTLSLKNRPTVSATDCRGARRLEPAHAAALALTMR